MNWRTIKSPKSRGYMGYVQLRRNIPPEWRQSFAERDNWHQFRIDQRRRRAALEPLATLGSVLTPAGQSA